MAIRPAAAAALRDAMAHLLAGEHRRTNGRLTWTNVYTEAGVPRATAARAHDLIAEWQDALKRCAPASAARVPAEEAHALKAQLAERARANAETVKNLRATIRTMANHIQALTLALEQRDAAIAALRADPVPRAGHVVPIRRT